MTEETKNPIKEKYAALMKHYTAFKDLERSYSSSKKILEELRQDFLDTLFEIGTDTYKGEAGTISVRESMVPSVEDWEKFYDYVKENDAFDLLQRRVSSTAYRDRLDDKEEVPGVKPFMRKSLNIRISR